MAGLRGGRGWARRGVAGSGALFFSVFFSSGEQELMQAFGEWTSEEENTFIKQIVQLLDLKALQVEEKRRFISFTVIFFSPPTC